MSPGSQLTNHINHKPAGRLPLLSDRATLPSYHRAKSPLGSMYIALIRFPFFVCCTKNGKFTSFFVFRA